MHDAHLEFAAKMLSISYEEAVRRFREGDEELREARHRAKLLHFMAPSGLRAVAFGIAIHSAIEKLQYENSITGCDILLYRNRDGEKCIRVRDVSRNVALPILTLEKFYDDTP